MKVKLVGVILIVLVVGIAAIKCSNPFKTEKKKELVLLFIDDYLVDIGRYIFFWNGKDDKNEFVAPGKYIVLLEIKSWQDQEYVTAEEGGKERANDQSRFEPGYWLYDDLQTPFPDTFFVKSGVNIPILLSSPGHVKISIYKD